MRQPSAILLTLLLSLPTLLAQSKSPEENPAMSDRAQAGLRGPVKSTTESSTYTDASGIPSGSRSEYTTVYDRDGRLLSTRGRNSDGSYWITRNEYSTSGRLLKTASGNEGQTLTETHYSYDSQHRLEKVATGNNPELPALFHYDEHGRKTKLQTWRASDYRPNTASGGSPFDAADTFPNLPGGGSTTTIYDEHDRPIEVQVHSADGELVTRASRTYDAQGHVINETQRYENVVSQFPPETRQKILDESGLSAEQLHQQLAAQLMNLMQGHPDVYSVSNQYDSAGRLVHTSRRIFNHEEEIDTTYNQQGDKESEVTRSTQPGSEPAERAQPSYSEARYSYQYDQHGNWTEQTVEYRSGPEAAFQSSNVIMRALTYY